MSYGAGLEFIYVATYCADYYIYIKRLIYIRRRLRYIYIYKIRMETIS